MGALRFTIALACSARSASPRAFEDTVAEPLGDVEMVFEAMMSSETSEGAGD
jgi:hypothetical protein